MYYPPHIPDPASGMKLRKYDAVASGPSGISVVKATVRFCGTPFDAVIDSGASHSMMSETQARKLQLFKSVQPTTTRFYTSSGKLEHAMGILVDVPITIGSFTMPTDVYVSHADSYNLLIGNNFLAAAEASIQYGNRELWIRKGIDSYIRDNI